MIAELGIKTKGKTTMKHIEVINIDTGDIDYLASSVEEAYSWIDQAAIERNLPADTWAIED